MKDGHGVLDSILENLPPIAKARVQAIKAILMVWDHLADKDKLALANKVVEKLREKIK